MVTFEVYQLLPFIAICRTSFLVNLILWQFVAKYNILCLIAIDTLYAALLYTGNLTQKIQINFKLLLDLLDFKFFSVF